MIQQDLRNGDIGETLVKNMFNKSEFDGVKNTGITYPLTDHDLLVFDKKNREYNFKIEIKYDIYSEKSGNIAIEFWNTNQDKPSGIDITKADLWCLVTPTKGIWLTHVNMLKEYIKKNLPERTIFSGGDGNANFYLYKMEKILPDIFIQCDTLSKSKFHKVIAKLLENGV